MNIQEYKNIIAEDKGRKSIADTLLALERTQGWKVIKLILEDRVNILQESINDIHNTKVEDVMEKRIELYYIKELLNMPRALADGLLSVVDQEHGEEVYE
jgi:hypothetical protein